MTSEDTGKGCVGHVRLSSVKRERPSVFSQPGGYGSAKTVKARRDERKLQFRLRASVTPMSSPSSAMANFTIFTSTRSTRSS